MQVGGGPNPKIQWGRPNPSNGVGPNPKIVVQD